MINIYEPCGHYVKIDKTNLGWEDITKRTSNMYEAATIRNFRKSFQIVEEKYYSYCLLIYSNCILWSPFWHWLPK